MAHHVGVTGHQLRNKEGTAMSKTMQRVSLAVMEDEAFKSGAEIEFDNEQGVAFLDISRTLTMYATFDPEAAR
jgi:hypothetical protein